MPDDHFAYLKQCVPRWRPPVDEPMERFPVYNLALSPIENVSRLAGFLGLPVPPIGSIRFIPAADLAALGPMPANDDDVQTVDAEFVE